MTPSYTTQGMGQSLAYTAPTVQSAVTYSSAGTFGDPMQQVASYTPQPVNYMQNEPVQAASYVTQGMTYGSPSPTIQTEPFQAAQMAPPPASYSMAGGAPPPTYGAPIYGAQAYGMPAVPVR
jgi:hypothetical protein